jgi:hypothetical protein
VPPPRVGQSVRWQTVREPYGPTRLKVRLVQEADINAVLSEELFQFQLPAAITISVPISQPQGLSPVSPRPHSHTRV